MPVMRFNDGLPGAATADRRKHHPTEFCAKGIARRVGPILLVAAIIALGAACNSPTAPAAASGNGGLSLGCGQESNGYQCRAQYTEAANSSPKDVTGLSSWSTSDSSLATVDSVGFVTVLRAGQVAVRASYRGSDAFLTMQVEPGGQSRYFRAVSGFVTDSRDATKLTGVTVLVIDGPNANRLTMTGSDGAYQLYDLQVGTFTIRFSKAGYATSDRVYTLTGDTFNDLSISLVALP